MTPKKGNDKVDRRDFINGMLIAAGAAAVGGSLPMRAYDGGTTFPCDGPIGSDPRALRSGNLPSVFNIAHWLRDNRLTFKTNSVLISSSHCCSYQGSQPILADNGNPIIVGAGMSGCSAAYYITRQRPGTRILILDGQRTPGGNANRDDAAPIPDIASTTTAYAVQPYAPFLDGIYNTTGILWKNYLVPSPFYSYYFDDMTPYLNAGTHSWNVDTYGKGSQCDDSQRGARRGPGLRRILLGSQYWADFVIADWVTSNRSNPNRPTVLTFYGGNTASVADQPNERIKLLTTTLSSYEDSLRADLNRVLAGRNFDFDRDVRLSLPLGAQHGLSEAGMAVQRSNQQGWANHSRAVGTLLRKTADRPNIVWRTGCGLQPCE